MSESPSGPRWKQRLREGPREFAQILAYVSFGAIPYAVLCACFYLHGYWQTFDIRFYEFVSTSDVLIYAVPLLFAMLLFVPVVSLVERGGPIFYALVAVLVGLFVAYIAAIADPAVIIKTFLGSRYVFVPALLAFSLAAGTVYALWSRAEVTRRELLLWPCIVAFPFCAIAHGSLTAETRLHHYFVQPIWVDNYPVASYVGSLGDHLFLLADRKTDIYRRSTTKVITIGARDNCLDKPTSDGGGERDQRACDFVDGVKWRAR